MGKKSKRESNKRDYDNVKPSKAPPKSFKSSEKKSGSTADPPSVKAEKSPEELTQIQRQQTLLNIFSQTLDGVFSSGQFYTTLQEVKQALYDREFAKAFSTEEYLEVYAARWSPTRALCYVRVLEGIQDHLRLLCGSGNADDEKMEGGGGASNDEARKTTLKMLSIGGGAAEIVAFASLLSLSENMTGDLILLDTGPWQEVVQKLHTSLTTPPELPQHVSSAAKGANLALVSESRLHSTFKHQDVLDLSQEQLKQVLGTDALLVTLLFTLNELYTSAGIGKTTSFLRTLTSSIPTNSLLLVVDSPGSYSEAAVGSEAKKYPMHWLLDHTLMRNDKLPTNGCKWKKLESQDSVWFRIFEDLRYPISLENMRYQMHLYRAVINPTP